MGPVSREGGAEMRLTFADSAMTSGEALISTWGWEN